MLVFPASLNSPYLSNDVSLESFSYYHCLVFVACYKLDCITDHCRLQQRRSIGSGHFVQTEVPSGFNSLGSGKAFTSLVLAS